MAGPALRSSKWCFSLVIYRLATRKSRSRKCETRQIDALQTWSPAPEGKKESFPVIDDL